ncbi:acetate--CoA ligase family protein [Nocardioides sediminis]|uniref:acetate--CoA ligase family protein n=1 Tax=Nocardioides sediminis TaxID=433648 RepID=UPI000D2F910C|nr:acetate--CoA ligase family protein [Nocardioides sediminis]
MRLVTGSEESIHRMWHPERVAIVGASGREHSLAWWPQRLLQQYGFAGDLIPVNPNRDEIGGLRCAPSIADVEGHVDVAVVTMDAIGTARAVAECAAAGVGAVVLPAQGFGEGGEDGKRVEREILEVARAAGMRIHGPNSDGIANFANGTVLSIQPVLGQGVSPGKVAVITQSGATAGSLVSRLADEGIGVKYYASAGNEIDLGYADYLSVALQDPEVEMVLSFVEAIRRPDDFVAVARLAAELGKPIVAIKVGRTDQAAARAAAHTGALAGEDRIYQALFDSLGVIRVDELSEVVAIAKLHLAVQSKGANVAGRDIAVMSVSGGQAGALADRAADFGLRLPAVSPATAERLDALFPHGNALNPCDLTGDVAKRADLAALAYEAFAADNGVDLLVYARKELTGAMGRDSATHLAEAAGRTSLPLVVYAMDGSCNDDERATYATHGVPVFASASELFAAVRGLADFAARPTTLELEVQREPVAAIPAGRTGALADEDAKALLAAYGIPFPAETVVTDADGAAKTASDIGFPVAMKVVSDRILHRTEMGGVVLRVEDEAGARSAFDLLSERAREALGGDDADGILVQQQVVDGVEILVGLVVDPQFGPFVVVGTGGVMTELLDDAVLHPAPVTPERAVAMVRSLKGFALLDGFRGAPPADVEALAQVVADLSRLGADHPTAISELDLNPVLVRPDGRGAVAVDALVLRAEGPA